MDLARGIGISLRIDNSTLARNYGHYARVLVDVDLAAFVPEKLLLETTVDCIEVDLYFESFPDFCTSCHSIGHPVAKCKSPSTHFIPTTNAFEILNTVVIPTHIEDMTHQQHTVPSNMADINQEMSITARLISPDLGVAPSRIDFDTEVGKSIRNTSENVRTTSNHTTVPRQITLWANAFGDSNVELGDDANDMVEDDWLPLQGEGSSKPSNEFDGTLLCGSTIKYYGYGSVRIFWCTYHSITKFGFGCFTTVDFGNPRSKFMEYY
ncbi:hypothetical protein FNV43_RR19219 [Rhamnella rubrinervis]|uniref:Zinc knuckle CX2CX4HX4C domain-containing protein n=1 Tax=Rhamnella rubrinervis TaxID=2594499 RepID=A0A8K0E5A0_9ROSA|nr:hypothetical protein FNV43_RR19219 [Rhamnella rubrinervis]